MHAPREVKLSNCAVLVRRGESVLWLKILGHSVHVTVSGKGHHGVTMDYLVDRLRDEGLTGE